MKVQEDIKQLYDRNANRIKDIAALSTSIDKLGRELAEVKRSTHIYLRVVDEDGERVDSDSWSDKFRRVGIEDILRAIADHLDLELVHREVPPRPILVDKGDK